MGRTPVQSVVLGIAVACGIAFVFPVAGCRSNRSESLVVYCAAVMRDPMQEIADAYQQRSGVRIELQFGGSNTLLGQIQIAKSGDLYVAADASYIRRSFEMGLTDAGRPVAQIWPVLIVHRGAAPTIKNVKTIDELLVSGARIAIADPDAAAIGRAVRGRLVESGHWVRLQASVRTSGVMMPTVSAVAGAVQLGSVDAGIVWNSVAMKYDGVAVITIDHWREVTSGVEIAVIRHPDSARSEQAADFADFVARDPVSRRILDRHGFADHANTDDVTPIPSRPKLERTP